MYHFNSQFQKMHLRFDVESHLSHMSRQSFKNREFFPISLEHFQFLCQSMVSSSSIFSLLLLYYSFVVSISIMEIIRHRSAKMSRRVHWMWTLNFEHSLKYVFCLVLRIIFSIRSAHFIFAPLSSSISEYYWVSTFEWKTETLSKLLLEYMTDVLFPGSHRFAFHINEFSMSFIQFALLVNRKSLLHLHKTRLHFSELSQPFVFLVSVQCWMLTVYFWWVVSMEKWNDFLVLLASKLSWKLIRVNLNYWAYFFHANRVLMEPLNIFPNNVLNIKHLISINLKTILHCTYTYTVYSIQSWNHCVILCTFHVLHFE